MNKEKNILKRYFLWHITSVFAVCFLSLGVGTSIVAFGVSRIPPDRLDVALIPLYMLGQAGLYLVLTILQIVAARLLANYNSKKSGLYFQIKDGEVDAANPQWGKDGDWVSLPRTDQPHEIDLAPGQDIPVMLRVIFRREESAFDPREVYKMVAVKSCYDFDDLVRKHFWQALRLAGLGSLLDQRHLHSSKSLEEKLQRLQTYFSVAALFNNVELVKVVITPKAEVDFS